MSTLPISRKTTRGDTAATRSLAARFPSRLRIPHVEVIAHPVLSGNRNYLRALRAAEMAAWESGLPRELALPFAQAAAATESA